MAREVVRRTLPKKIPEDMEEMYSSPRKHDVDVVKHILRLNKIKYKSTEENKGYGMRYYVYTLKKQSKHIYKLLDEELSERGM